MGKVKLSKLEKAILKAHKKWTQVKAPYTTYEEAEEFISSLRNRITNLFCDIDMFFIILNQRRKEDD